MATSSQGIPQEEFLATLIAIAHYLNEHGHHVRGSYLEDLISRVTTPYINLAEWKELIKDRPLDSAYDVYAINQYLTRGDDPLLIIKRPDIITQFTHINGIDSQQAELLYHQGYHSLRELWPTLTRWQQLSYYYYKQLREPLSREEVNQYGPEVTGFLALHDITAYLVRSTHHLTLIIRDDPGGSAALPLLIDHHIVIAYHEGEGLLRFKPGLNVHHFSLRFVSPAEYPFRILKLELDPPTWARYQEIARHRGYRLTESGMEGCRRQFTTPSEIITFLE